MFYPTSLCCSAPEWKVPTTFIYGTEDWMNYEGAQEARKHMKVPCEIIRVPQVLFSSLPPQKWSNFIIIRTTKLITSVAGRTFCVHRQPKWLPFSCVICLSKVSYTKSRQWIFSWRAILCVGYNFALILCILFFIFSPLKFHNLMKPVCCFSVKWNLLEIYVIVISIKWFVGELSLQKHILVKLCCTNATKLCCEMWMGHL
jgi:hypothetical protein